MMPTAEDTAYDYTGPDPQPTEDPAPVPTTPTTRSFPVCIGNGSVPILITPCGTGGGSRVTSQW